MIFVYFINCGWRRWAPIDAISRSLIQFHLIKEHEWARGARQRIEVDQRTRFASALGWLRRLC